MTNVNANRHNTTVSGVCLKLIQRIRGIALYALCKFRNYLLAYLLTC